MRAPAVGLEAVCVRRLLTELAACFLVRDCGLACVLMVLRALGATQCDLPTMRLLCQTTSVWTIDLAHLLRRFGVEVTFCTVTLGANPDFVHEARTLKSIGAGMHGASGASTPHFPLLCSPSTWTRWRRTDAALSSCSGMRRR